MNEQASVTISVSDNIAAEAASAGAAFRARAELEPGAIAFTDSIDREARSLGTPRTITYGQGEAIIARIEHELRNLGLSAGDIIAIQAPNVVEVPLVILAAWRVGLVPSVMPVMWQLDEIYHAFSKTKPKAAITVSKFGTEHPAITLGEAAARHMSIRYLLSLGENPPDGITPIDDWFSIPEADTAGDQAGETSSDPPPDALAIITWMTGRHGNLPVPRTHAELVELGRMFTRTFGLKRRDVVLNPYPYSNVAAIAGQLVAPILAGAQTILHLPFDFSTFVSQLEIHRVTCALAPAPVIAALEDRRDLHSTRFKLRQLGCVWPSPHAVKSGPGLFEPTLPTIDIHSFAEFAVLPRHREPGSDPSLLPLGKIRSDDDDPDSEIILETRIRGSVKTRDEKQILAGTLTVRGTTVPGGLFVLDAARQGDAQGPYRPDSHGFIDTSISCITGDDMMAHFRCQKSDGVIYHGGTALAASDLDQLYASFDEFLDAAAFALDDASIGERIFAAVVPQPDLSPSLDRFKHFLAQKRVASYKVPDQLIIVRSIPRSSDGAVLRDQILAQI